MKYIKGFPLILLSFLILISTAYGREKMNLNDIISNAIIQNETTPIVISNVEVVTENLKYKFLFEYLESKIDEKILKIENDKVLISSSIIFKNCTFNSLVLNRLHFKNNLSFKNCQFTEDVQFTKTAFSEISIEDCFMKSINVSECEFNGHLISEWNEISDLNIISSEFRGITKLVNYVKQSVEITGSTFYPQTFPCTIISDSIGYGRAIFDNLQLIIANSKMNTIDQVILRNNAFLSNESINKVAIQADINQLIIEGNSFRSSFDLNKTSISKRLIIRNNIFHDHVGFNDVIFPELFNIVDWDQFAGLKLCIFEPTPVAIKYECAPNYRKIQRISDLNSILYLAENDAELSNKDSYNLIISIYQRLYNIYKINGDISSSNGCYSEMKDVQSRMLKFKFKEKRSFNNFFRWKLAQLLKTYVDHGTDPARAITISVYVIMIFAIFYFFFPSEWDVSSKSKLIREFSEYIRHNDRSDIKRFLVVVWGLSISMLNAITLSLNAFTTLGFGNIPTKGAARYICVVQGFIGWFLLSIFTVALINQVLG